MTENDTWHGAERAKDWAETPQIGTKTDINPPFSAVFDPKPVEIASETPETAETPGRMLTAVENDLAHLEQLDKGVRGSLAALARELARAMDATGDERPTPAQVGQLAQQLRTTLNALANVAGDTSVAERFFAIMNEAVQAPVADETPRRKRNPKATAISADDE